MSAIYTLPSVAPSAAALALLYITIFTFLIPAFSAKHNFWKAQPWVGQKKQWFAGPRAQFSTINNTRSLMIEGHEKYGKHNKIFMLPQLGSAPLAIVPQSHIKEIMAMPDSAINIDVPLEENISNDRLLGPGIGHSQAVQFGVVRRQLTRKLPSLTNDVHAELAEAMKQQWPATADTWTSVKVVPTVMNIVSQAANRVFCGKELCRNPDFIENSTNFTVAVFTLGFGMKMVPKWLHAVVHAIFKGTISNPLNTCKKIALPEIRRRLKQMQDPNLSESYEAPYDALQWLLEDLLVQAKSDPSVLDEDLIAKRLLNLNMVAIHTTSQTTTNTILDIYSSPNKDSFVAGLREECERALDANGGQWTKDAVNSLVRVDSAIRESMRLSGLSDVATTRLVTDPNGIVLSDGTHIPNGVYVAFNQSIIHTDSSNYPDNPTEFDAFRFSAPREEYLAQVSDNRGSEHRAKVLEAKNQAMIAVGPDFLGFGAGRHACPGRFFASQEMKLALAHIVMTYDIKIEGGRPANQQVNAFWSPSAEAEIQVRLRRVE